MKIKSLLAILLLSLFAIALEAQLSADEFATSMPVELQVIDTSDIAEEADDDERIFLDLECGVTYTHKLVKKIDFHDNFVKQEASLEIQKPPIVL